MDPSFEFVQPHRLWLLLAVVALATSYVASQARRNRYAVRFTNLALLDGLVGDVTFPPCSSWWRWPEWSARSRSRPA